MTPTSTTEMAARLLASQVFAPSNEGLLRSAKKYVEFCIQAYALFAQETQFAYDPFSSNYGGSKEIQKLLKLTAACFRQVDRKNLTFVSYDLGPSSRIDFRQPTFSGSDRSYFEPTEFTERIGRIFPGQEQEDQKAYILEYGDRTGQNDSIDIYLFEGVPGASGDRGGLSTPMGYVAYDRESKEITVTFRGSRSSKNVVETVLKSLFLEEGSADWVTDMSVARELKECREVAASGGPMVEGFVSTYLSCRSQLIRIIQEISKDDPAAKPQLVFTGHSLGGGLATVAWIDSQSGELAEKLGAGGEELCKSAQCFAISAPHVCSQDTIARNLREEQLRQYHRVYFENDPIVWGGNVLRFLRGKTPFEDTGLLVHLSSPDEANLDLGKYSRARWSDLFCPHEPYLIFERIQDELGVTEGKRYWDKLDEYMDIVHAAKYNWHGKLVGTPLSPEQAAHIVAQFDYSYFTALAMQMAELEAASEEEIEAAFKKKGRSLARSAETELMRSILKDVGTLFAKLNPGNPDSFLIQAESEAEFEKFKDELSRIIKRLESKVLSYKGQAAQKSFGGKMLELGKCILDLLIKIVGVIKGLVKNIINWLAFKVKARQERKIVEPALKGALDAMQSCYKKVEKLHQQLLDIEIDKLNLETLGRNLDGLIEVCKSLQKAIDRAEDAVVEENDRVLLANISKLVNKFTIYVSLTNTFMRNQEAGKLAPEKIQQELVGKLNEFIDGIYQLGKSSKQSPSLGEKIQKIVAGSVMSVSGLAFTFEVACASIVANLYRFGEKVCDIFRTKSVTQEFVQKTLKDFSLALSKTNLQELRKVILAVKKLEVIPVVEKPTEQEGAKIERSELSRGA